MFAVWSTKAGFWPPSSSRTGARFSAAARATTFPTLVLPVKKMKSKGSFRSSVVSSRPPATAQTARGSKYFGTSSSSTADVADKAGLSLRTQAGGQDRDSGPKQQCKGAVGRPDDQDHAVRVAINHSLVASLGKRRGNRCFRRGHP